VAAKKPLGRAYAAIRERHDQVHFDTDGLMTRYSLILVAAVLQPDADNAMRRWDELREQRAREKEAREDFKRRSETEHGHFI